MEILSEYEKALELFNISEEQSKKLDRVEFKVNRWDRVQGKQ